MTTLILLPAVVGVNEVIVGRGIQVKPVLVAVPPAVVTLTVPVVPVPTVAVICVAEFTTKEVAAVPSKLTAEAPVKFVPVMTTLLVSPAVDGVKEEMVGVGAHVNPESVPVPKELVTVISPEVPVPTVAVIWVVELTV
jgi:hypothetical protein